MRFRCLHQCHGECALCVEVAAPASRSRSRGLAAAWAVAAPDPDATRGPASPLPAEVLPTDVLTHQIAKVKKGGEGEPLQANSASRTKRYEPGFAFVDNSCLAFSLRARAFCCLIFRFMLDT